LAEIANSNQEVKQPSTKTQTQEIGDAKYIDVIFANLGVSLKTWVQNEVEKQSKILAAAIVEKTLLEDRVKTFQTAFNVSEEAARDFASKIPR
jgi:hypothetical protein